ncbi:hypothetical protein ACFQY4_17315 [Catellatospora bangladeshensis]|uniref:Transmembrane transport protein n=1 Tax=Catellatospora bangladeshensis TaxID=310355 RepID=A0A8J3JW94_9ACTN|nr:hypothetical protein [Catellatospora bangladeshensis]GIF86295.1 hypothetical protein Cba03nite_76440 [Catellatospora bangladeshensis]
MSDQPRLSAQEIVERLGTAVSRRARIRAVTALVAGLSGAALVSLLWLTEPEPLPGRTRLAFALLTAICLAWAGYGGWLLTRKVVLFAADRVVAAWIALSASTATTVLLAVIAAGRGTGLWPVLAVGAVFAAVSLLLLARAHRERARLLRRRAELTT